MNINTLEVETVELHDVRIRPEEAIPVHTQNTWEFNLILKGHGTRTIGGRSEPFRAGDFVVVPPKMPHGWCYDPKSAGRDKMVKNIALFVNPNWLKKAAKIFPTLTHTLKAFLARTTAFTLSPEKEAEMTDFLRGLVSVEKQFLPLATLEFIHRLEQSAGICPLTDATTPQAKEEELIMHLRAYISSNYMRKISLSSAARHAGMSRSRFCAFFKEATGTTFVHAVNACRIEEACRLLSGTSYSIAEIAERIGYSDSAYFNRQFNALKNQSPLAWRKSHHGLIH